MRIKQKLVFFTVILVSVSIMLPSYFAVNFFSEQLKEEIGKEFAIEASEINHEIAKFMFEKEADVAVIGKINSLENSYYEREDLMQFLREVESIKKSYAFFSIYDTSGIKVADTRSYGIGFDSSQENYFINAINGQVFSESTPSFHDGLNQFVLHVSAPYYDADNNIQGAIVAGIPISKINNIVASHQKDIGESKIDLITENGIVIFSTHDKESISSKKNFGYNLEFEKDIVKITDETISFIDKNKNFVLMTGSDDYLDFQGTGWTLFFSIPTSEIFSEIQTLTNNFIIIAIIILISSITAIFSLTKFFTEPIAKLNVATKNVAEGKLDERINITSKDEFGELAESFTKMTESISKVIELEKQIAVSKVQIKNERLSAIGELAARLAHDLRNPLAVIKMGLDLMLSRADEKFVERNRTTFEQIERSMQRVNHQIANVLDFVKERPLKYENVEIGKMFSVVSELVHVPVNIKITLPEKSGIKYWCDRSQIEIVFANIIMNSIQAIGTDQGKIEFIIKESESKICIDIIDSGPGIPDEKIEKIFEPLFTTKETGTGLGLSGCKKIIESHGGIISVKNNPTTFTIELPKRSSEEIKIEQIANIK